MIRATHEKMTRRVFEPLGVIHHHMPIAIFQVFARQLTSRSLRHNSHAIPAPETLSRGVISPPFPYALCLGLKLARSGIFVDVLAALCGVFNLAAQFLEVGGVFRFLRRFRACAVR